MSKNTIKVIVKDFMILKNISLEIDGMTALIGESNNGKSSIYNAIKALVYNASGNSYIRIGASESKVGLQLDDEGTTHRVFFTKGKSPKYKLNNVEFEKVGRTVPEEVEAALNLLPVTVEENKYYLNFLDQLSSPLMKSLSESQLYSLTIKSFDGEKVNEAIKANKKDMDVTSKKINEKSIEHSVHKKNRLELIEQAKVYKELVKLKTEHLSYEASFGKLDRVRALMEKRAVAVNRIHSGDILIKKLVGLDKVEEDLKLVLDKKSKGELSGAYLGRKREIKHKLDHVTGILNVGSYATLHSLSEKMIMIKDKDTKLAKITGLIARRTVIISEIKSVGLETGLVIEEHKAEKFKLDNKLCPKCSQEIKIETKDNIMALNEIEEKVKKLNKKKTTFEGQKKLLEEQLQELDKEIREEGLDPDNLEKEAEKIKGVIDSFEEKAKPVLAKIEKEISAVEGNGVAEEEFTMS